ncbi:hypothetical protein C4D60_Mb01t31510 [Musa balbisiana]|uniref:Uncharacterized protein n=1 Tax=Musa balbisiana TaxID=52838 RepID=A0A4S8JS60_MUSBA|nr:hypothetical protein C4D60_Mb01t31510 [Musa balbisiana]
MDILTAAERRRIRQKNKRKKGKKKRTTQRDCSQSSSSVLISEKINSRRCKIFANSSNTEDDVGASSSDATGWMNYSSKSEIFANSSSAEDDIGASSSDATGKNCIVVMRRKTIRLIRSCLRNMMGQHLIICKKNYNIEIFANSSNAEDDVGASSSDDTGKNYIVIFANSSNAEDDVGASSSDATGKNCIVKKLAQGDVRPKIFANSYNVEDDVGASSSDATGKNYIVVNLFTDENDVGACSLDATGKNCIVIMRRKTIRLMKSCFRNMTGQHLILDNEPIEWYRDYSDYVEEESIKDDVGASSSDAIGKNYIVVNLFTDENDVGACSSDATGKNCIVIMRRKTIRLMKSCFRNMTGQHLIFATSTNAEDDVGACSSDATGKNYIVIFATSSNAEDDVGACASDATGKNYIFVMRRKTIKLMRSCLRNMMGQHLIICKKIYNIKIYFDLVNASDLNKEIVHLTSDYIFANSSNAEDDVGASSSDTTGKNYIVKKLAQGDVRIKSALGGGVVVEIVSLYPCRSLREGEGGQVPSSLEVIYTAGLRRRSSKLQACSEMERERRIGEASKSSSL